MNATDWPALEWSEWKDTAQTVLLWTQVAGKIRLAQSPWVNHSWGVTLYLTARGLTTSPMPHGRRMFEIEFDFVDHRVRIAASDGAERAVPLRPRSVADFHDELFARLGELELPVTIDRVPNEVEDGTRLDRDRTHAAYDADAARRWWQAMLHTQRVLQVFRSPFIGKCSPIHYFWGGGDLAVTRFSGRTAPVHPGGIPHLDDRVTREAYSHEVSSAGFWPGGLGLDHAAFYSYAYPAPAGFEAVKVRPADAYFHPTLREFVLPYDAVRKARDPEATLLEFLESTYEAAATLGRWDRTALERPGSPWQPPRPRGSEAR